MEQVLLYKNTKKSRNRQTEARDQETKTGKA